MSKLKIDMQDAVRYLALPYPVSGTRVNAVCPVCGNPEKPSKKKLCIDYSKNVFRCNKCGWSGGVLDFWAYHKGLEGRAQAARNIDMFLKSGKHKAEEKAYMKPCVNMEEVTEEAPSEAVESVLRAFLSMLELSAEDRENLRKRGLSDIQIEKGGYRSLPEGNIERYCSMLLEKGFSLKGVPGFYMKDDNTWTFRKMTDGFLIPTSNIEGMLQGLQIRSNDPLCSIRYMTVSSYGMRNGTRGRALPHFNEGDGNLTRLVITEGPLKGNIIAESTGIPVLAVLGVNTIGTVPEILESLKKKGLEEVYIAYDMDRFENEHVMEAQEKLKRILSEKRIPHTELVWDERYKGLDDYIAGKIE